MYTNKKEKNRGNEKPVNSKKESTPASREDEKKKALDDRWLKSKRSSTEQSIMDAGRQPGELK